MTATPKWSAAGNGDHKGRAWTLEEYQALDKAGLITRPITDAPIGRYTATKRSNDAAASAAITQTPTPLDEHRKESAAS